MDSDRHHRTGSTTTSELFVCFTSRLSSSSSIKISKSSSIHSPGRSLSSSLSRRLKPNSSIKAWHASPMFPTKKRAGTFENPEPSSPKVTCIGQVRVKTKKQRKKLQRRHTGDFSFRKVELRNHDQNQNQNQNPNQNSICESLRSIGADFSCFLPCKSSCFSTGEREEKGRWLVAMNDAQGDKGREIELVVDGREDEEEGEEEVLPVRRHVFDDLEIEDLMPKFNKDEDIDEGRVSICVPPKNALLLMRCRSDPVKMEDLTNRFWISSLQVDDDDDDEEEEAESPNIKEKRDSIHVTHEEQVTREAERMKILQSREDEQELNITENQVVDEEEVNPLINSTFEALADIKSTQSNKDDDGVREEEIESNSENETKERYDSNPDPEEETRKKEEEFDGKDSKRLPDCLLLMMCEPKLSMEVSKETWVCSTDFIRWQPDKKVNQNNGVDQPKKRISIDSNSNPPLIQPPRSSCSYPPPPPEPEPEADVSMATVIEQKLVSAVGCEPFVLTRCKSAPLKAAQDSCFWKNRNLEPHRRSSVGVSTAGVGF